MNFADLKWHSLDRERYKKCESQRGHAKTSAEVISPAESLSTQGRHAMTKQAKNTICVWYNGGAEEAARFYAKTFPDSSVGTVLRAPGDYPAGKQGNVL